MPSCARRPAIFLTLVLLALPAAAARRAPAPNRFAVVDAILNQAVRQGEIPGAVALVGHNGKIVYRRAWGYRQLVPRRQRMTLDTIFDLASLTKVVATVPALMQLLARGEFRLNDPVAMYLPEFAQNGKQEVTIRQLLTHFSGLPPDLDLTPPWEGKQAAFSLVMAADLESPPGARFSYSDINFIVLGFLVEKLAGAPLDQYAATHIFAPLGMRHTRFTPPASWLPKIAPTQYDEHGVMLRGVVHDPTARRMGGVAGHAGLFSTAADLARYAQALLDGNKILDPLLIAKMTSPQQPANATVLRGLGWDLDSPYSTNRGELLPIGSYGHTGFTGTSLWIDPSSKTYIILLSNSVHPNGQRHEIVSLRARVANAVTEALKLHVSSAVEARDAAITGYNETLAGERRLADRSGQVSAGIDMLEAQNFQPILGQFKDRTQANPVKILLLTNQTGVDAEGRRTIDVLAQAPGIKLQAICSPEHGPEGTLDTTGIAPARDEKTGVPVVSVYGATEAERRPPQALVASADAIVIDLQDAGVRFYTYETTVGYFLEAAAQAGKPIFILDRPNLITGSFVQGPVSEPAFASFTNYHPLPVRHGMTLGELARLFNAERNLHANLTVVAMAGWQRGDWYDATDLSWINPSPNLRSLAEATLYPGVALVEGTNVSVGRGTDTPFEVLGAPWITARQLADFLNRREIAGVRFVPISFTPDSGAYAHQLCQGVNLIVTDRNSLAAPELGIELASALLRLYPHDYQMDSMIRLLANQRVFNAIQAGEDPRRIAEGWRADLEQFQKLREKYLLYH